MVNETEIKNITEQVVEKLMNSNNDNPTTLSYDPHNTTQPGICDGSCIDCGTWWCVAKNPNASQNIINAGADRLGTSPGIPSESQKIASMIDHTLLKPEANMIQMRNLCAEASKYHFYSVCVNPGWVSFCKKELQGSNVKTITVIGFPLGATTTESKAFETRDAIANGADEIDMVINVGWLKSKRYDDVEDDIRAVVQAAKGKPVKVIIETALLNDDEKVKACQLAKSAGANYVKTSTGFAKGGATVHDIELMRRTVGGSMGVKASGGVKSLSDAQAMIKAGATRIGASASVAIVKGEKSGAGY